MQTFTEFVKEVDSDFKLFEACDCGCGGDADKCKCDENCSCRKKHCGKYCKK